MRRSRSQTRSDGSHGNFVHVQNISHHGRKPSYMRVTANSSYGCIDATRMYQPGFAVYINLEIPYHVFVKQLFEKTGGNYETHNPIHNFSHTLWSGFSPKNMSRATVEKTVLMFKGIPRVVLMNIDITTKVLRPTAVVTAMSTVVGLVLRTRVILAMDGVIMTATMSVILMIENQIQKEIGKALL